MAKTTPARKQRMRLVRLTGNLYNWDTVYACQDDPRLYILCRGIVRTPAWFFGVIFEFHQRFDQFHQRFDRFGMCCGQLDHQAGPFGTQAKVEDAARRWFLHHPSGAVAELLAWDPYNPSI